MFWTALGLFCLSLGRAQTPGDYSSAVALVREGRFDAAIPMLEALLSASPNDLKARNLLGIALLNAGRKEEASLQFHKALVADPKFTPALKNLAINEMALGQAREAQLHFEQLLKLVPGDAVAHLYLGEIAFGAQNYSQALEHYQKSGGLHLKDPQSSLHFARSAIEEKQTAVAEQALDGLPGDAAQFQFDAGVLLAGAKRYEAAARHFELAQAGYSDPYQVGFNLTLVYLDGGNARAAIETGEKLATRYEKAELYNLLARAYEAGGRTQEAYDALRRATRIDPRDELNYLDLMSLCLTHENWDLSLEISEVALNQVPQSFRVRMERGAVLAMKGRLDDAGKEFAEATSLAPQSDLPAVALAVVRLEMKKPQEAIQVLRPLRQHGTKDYRVDWFLAQALNQEGAEPGSANEKEAVAALEESVRLEPKAVAPRILLGKMLGKRGAADLAMRQFEEALKLDPNDTNAAYQLAVLYRKAGKMERAEELMAQVGKATSASDPGTVTGKDLVKIVREGAK